MKPLVCLIVLLSVGLYGAAASAADLKVGVVDLQKILQDAPQVKQVKAQLKKEFAPQQRELLAMQQDLQAVEQKLTKKGATMSDSEREAANVKASTLQHEIQQRRNDFLDDLNLRRNQELSKLQRLVLQEVNSYADENHFDLVIGDGVFYASKRINITDEIIKRLGRDFAEANKKTGNSKTKKSDK
ncbi:MAG TPA: OmpH family outer membrane protein [Gammaproteobacteria bacterium]|nr:OmpH family outer membrane protein [Gammaproteobacteria bacterium]